MKIGIDQLRALCPVSPYVDYTYHPDKMRILDGLRNEVRSCDRIFLIPHDRSRTGSLLYTRGDRQTARTVLKKAMDILRPGERLLVVEGSTLLCIQWDDASEEYHATFVAAA